MKVSLKVSLKWVASADHLVIMLFVCEYIAVKLIFPEISSIERFYMGINLRKQNLLICSSYNPNMHNASKHIETLSKSVDFPLWWKFSFDVRF